MNQGKVAAISEVAKVLHVSARQSEVVNQVKPLANLTDRLMAQRNAAQQAVELEKSNSKQQQRQMNSPSLGR